MQDILLKEEWTLENEKNLEWVPQENKKRVERPKTRWGQEIIQYAVIACGKDARVRDQWRKAREAYARF